MEKRYSKNNNPYSDGTSSGRSGYGGTDPELRAYPQAKRVYVSPDYEEDARGYYGGDARGRAQDRYYREDARGYYDETPRSRAQDRYYEDERSSVSAWDEVLEDEETERTRKSRRRWLICMIPILIILAVAVGVLGKMWLDANDVREIQKSGKIFPKVSIGDVAVGGLTPQEALEKLEASGADAYQNASITVRFPQGITQTLTAKELGLKTDFVEAINQAYACGRSGKLLEDISALRKEKNISLTQTVSLDEAYLRQSITTAANQLTPEGGGFRESVEETGVRLTVSTGVVQSVNVDDVCNRVIQAFRNKNYADIQVETEETGEKMSQEDITKLLQGIYDEVHVEMQNAEYDAANDIVKEAVRGVSFNVAEALAMWNAAEPGQEIFIPFEFTEPEVTAEDLVGELFTDLLAEKSTSLSGSTSARINNVNLTAIAMDETVVNPGEAFDYNTCLGQRTAAKGYQEAGAYSGGKHVQEIGGGICQGSSTLYYCALKANLWITCRECHYFTVSYLPRGFDATVSWGGPDFRFVNNRSYPIKIKAWVYGGYLTVQIWGTSDGTTVDLTSDTWEDDEFYYAQTYRAVYAADGTLISKTAEAYSRYHKYEVDAETPEPSPTATPEPTDTPVPTDTPEPTETPEPITPEPITPEPLTPEPLTPEPLTPEPLTPEPLTPEPVTPEPVTPEPVTPEPVTPEPVTPEPATPEPVPDTPEPVPDTPEPEPEMPEPVTPEPAPEPTPEPAPEPLPEDGE